MRKIIPATILILISFIDYAQKPLIDSAALDDWPFVRNPIISNNGKFAAFTTTTVPKGKSSTVLKNLEDGWEKHFIGANSERCSFSPNSRYFVVLNWNDTLILADLNSKILKYRTGVKSYKLLSSFAKTYVAFQEKKSENLVVLDLDTNLEHLFPDVINYEFDKPAFNLLVQAKYENRNINESFLELIDLNTFSRKRIMQGKIASNFIFDTSGKKLAFLEEAQSGTVISKLLCYYQFGDDSGIVVSNTHIEPNDDSLVVVKLVKFDNAGNKIFVNLSESAGKMPKKAFDKVNVWSYKDKMLQSAQLIDENRSRTYRGVFDIKKGAIARLEFVGENLQDNFCDDTFCEDSLKILIKTCNDPFEWNWNKNAYALFYLVSTNSGSRKLIFKHKYPTGNLICDLTPDGKYAIYYDREKKNYFSYSTSNEITNNITEGVQANWEAWEQEDRPRYSIGSLGVAGWVKNTSHIILYDRYDVFEVDAAGIAPPINLTNGYGRMHKLVLRLAFDRSANLLGKGDKIILNAFDLKTKKNGFYSTSLGKVSDPRLLILDSCIYLGPYESESLGFEPIVKAVETNMYIVRRMTASSSPNYYFTPDFKSFSPLSSIHPELNYNWLTTQLLSWKQLDGTMGQGILYKPENFDRSKKYPVIIFYYEKLSERLNAFLRPDYSDGPMNIPYFVSHGYLVFTPDIKYKVGYPGNSVMNSVLSAGKHLQRFSFVDGSRIGIHGHSRGGYETNYLITHTKLFAAAVSACGMSDYVSLGLEIRVNGRARAPGLEIYSQRIGATLWERPDLYTENSPIFSANKITTPILIMANSMDSDVPFSQGLELYLALRRLNKKAWMLEYDDEDHTLGNQDALKDYSIRLMQFFDYYLKNKLPPRWMTEGIPAKMKGLDNKLDFDNSGAIP